MAHVILISFLCLTIIWITTKSWSWRKAYIAARSTQFPVFFCPVHINDTWWMMFYPVLVPVLSMLPGSWVVPWLSLSQIWNIWKLGYKPFEDVQSDTLVLATPQGNVLWTCDAKLCHQLETSPSKSRVPVDAIKFFEVYGPAIGTVEGSDWKKHRKVITSAFTSDTHQKVWTETVRQTSTLIDHWSTQGYNVPIAKNSTSRLALHVICAVFFNKNLEWNEHSLGFEPAPPGHTISFEQAMFTVVSRLGVLAVTPKALLGVLPVPIVREAYIAFKEWARYMEELREAADVRLAQDGDENPKNVLESIIIAGRRNSDDKYQQKLSEESVLGNIFFTIMAGHETVGNALAFALYLLAIYPEYQEKVRKDLQPLLEKRPWDEWSVDQEYQTLHRGWTGAILKEVLRPYAVVPFITRRIVAPITVVDSNGETHVIPENTIVSLDYAAAFRNPATWLPRADVSSERRSRLRNAPGLDFDPSRWLGSDNRGLNVSEDVMAPTYEQEQENKDSKPSDSSGPPLLFPFGQGPRTCPGRTFASVEMTAALVTILKDYDLQLVVNEHIKRECNGDETLAWEKVRDDALTALHNKIETNITIELNSELPFQLIKR